MLRLSCPLLLLLVFLLLGECAHKLQATSETQQRKNNDDISVAGLKGKLIFAHVLFRHGDRTPVEPYPTDPWKSLEDWPTGWGQLTNTGKEQLFELGQWLRTRYDTLLSRTYSKDEIYIRSTDVDRTLMSALSSLAGLYPPENTQIWNSDIAWQPIPVHTMPERMDRSLAGKEPCAAYEYAKSSLLNSPEFQKIHDRYAYLFKYLTQYTGGSVDTLEAVQRINNTLFIESLYNKTLPEWTKKVYPGEDMTYVSEFVFAINTYTRQMARLKMGPLIKEILQRFQEKAKHQLNPDRTVFIYSAHDTTLSSLLNALNLFDMHSPPYSACILMELRLDDEKIPFVSIFYKNSNAEPLPLNIPGCGIACPLSKMYSLYTHIIPEDWDNECKLSTLMMTYEEADIGMAMGILVAIITLMLFLSYITMVYYRRRSYRNYQSYSQKSQYGDHLTTAPGVQPEVVEGIHRRRAPSES